jgi:hypothetical protein
MLASDLRITSQKEFFGPVPLESVCRLACTQDVCLALDVVGYDSQTDFCACSGTTSHEEARVSEHSVLDGGERGVRLEMA